jgi:IS5 family transposase
MAYVGGAGRTAGSDRAQMAPMVEQVIERTGCTPGQWLVDGGFPAHEQIDAVHEHTQGKAQVIAPVPEPRRNSGDEHTAPVDKHQRKEGDSEAVAQWRSRMAGDEAKELYKQRAATAECVNALARNRGLQRMPVRGLSKVRAVAYLYALAHNLMRMARISPQLLGLGTSAPAVAAAAA